MLQYVPLPETWGTKSYNNKPYYLVNIPLCSDEYSQVENHFDGYTIVKVERVQNPYQYGKYLLYRLQKNSPTEVNRFMPVSSSSALDLALRFNCDYRRLGWDTDMFFQTVLDCITYDSSYGKLIILQGLNNCTSHDSGRYPKWVVTYESRRDPVSV